MKNIVVLCLTVIFFACQKKIQVVPPYAISKVFKSDTLNIVNVHINSRMTAVQLLLIAGKVKNDISGLSNLTVHYLLPGNTDLSAGDNSYYASAKLVKEEFVKPTDTLKDDVGNVFRVNIFGLNQAQARHLLSMQPKEITGKEVLGKFIDDYNHTVIIPFKDVTDKKHDLYVIEVDSGAKIVSATMPLRQIDNGIEKWLVTQNGDYITLKDNVLTQYAADGLGIPFNSIKSGI